MQDVGSARTVSGSAWPHASAQAVSPPGRRRGPGGNASPRDMASAVPAARALRLLGPSTPPGAGANSPVARSQENRLCSVKLF